MVFNTDLIDFFKRNNLYDKYMFDYFSNNSTIIDYEDLEQRIFIGTFYVNDKNGRLKKIHLNLPYIYDDKTMLISIHEIVHGIILYKYINKKYEIGIDCEVIPMLYEKIFIIEKNSPELTEYGIKLDNMIDSNNDKKYILGLKLRDVLIDSYDYNINKLNIKVKKLMKKYEKENNSYLY